MVEQVSRERISTLCCQVLASEMKEEEAQEWATLFQALADKSRVQILELLRRYPGEVCVCNLVAALPLEQPTVSHHLSVLRNAGLIGVRRRGVWAYYYPKRDALVKLKQSVDQLVSQEAG